MSGNTANCKWDEDRLHTTSFKGLTNDSEGLDLLLLPQHKSLKHGI